MDNVKKLINNLENTHMINLDKMKEECGIFGIYSCNPIDTYTLTKFGLFALQHRGQEAAGIATLQENGIIKVHKGDGLVAEVFDRNTSSDFVGVSSIGHVRYATTGGSNTLNIQPLYITDENKRIKLTIAHNGNLTNSTELRAELIQERYEFLTTSDTEIILKLLYKFMKTMCLTEAVRETAKKIKGAYSLLIMTEKMLIALRDPHAIRPLCMGKINEDTYVFSSESCGLDAVDAKLEKFLSAGEMIVMQGKNIQSIIYAEQPKTKTCSFEYIYFSRPDSNIDNISAYEVREKCGQYLYQQQKIDADIVVGVPDSGTPAAVGYAQVSGIPYKPLLLKNRYMGRSFIAPTQEQRNMVVNLKLNTIRQEVRGKRIIIIDDSIVRGTTSRFIVDLFRKNEAKEVHFLSASPPIISPCFLGIDTPDEKDLIAANYSKIEIAKKLNADTVDFLELSNLHKLLNEKNHCYGCFTGNYPVS